MNKIVKLMVVLGIAFSLLNCPSTPKPVEKPPEKEQVVEKPAEEKPKPPEKPKEEPKEEQVVKKPEVKPVTVEEIKAIRSLIARAEEADASYYDPDSLKEAKANLDKALAVKDKDPDKAREYLKEAKEKALLAFDNSVERAANDLSARMDRLMAALKKVEAERFMPSMYRDAVSGIEEAKSLYKANRLVEARDKAYEALRKMSELYDLLTKRIRWVNILRRDTEQYLDDAEKAEASVWAPEELSKTNELYFKGVEAFQEYDLDSSEEYLGSAREAAKDTVRLALQRKVAAQKKKAENLMIEVMKEIEEASKLTVVTDEGTVIEPKPWSGEDILKEEEEKSKEKDNKEGSDDQSLLLPIKKGEVVVLGDVSKMDFLEQAKELWRLGVKEKNEGNYERAMEYFLEAKKYIAAYKNLAVSSVYTVRLIPERRDCLWRIAEYDFIYGDPYLWPKIWRRNRKLIQNPDLIYPGWKLVIPPK